MERPCGHPTKSLRTLRIIRPTVKARPGRYDFTNVKTPRVPNGSHTGRGGKTSITQQNADEVLQRMHVKPNVA